MALAELASRRYEVAPGAEQQVLCSAGYTTNKVGTIVAEAVLLGAKKYGSRTAELEFMRIALQSRRQLKVPQTKASNRPVLSGWINLAIDGAMILSWAIVVIAFFIFLLELSAGRPEYLVPSFSAFFIFSIIGLVAFRLWKSIKFIQSDSLPQ
ncbi:hypothetical protein [Antarcticimicrobium sediminis]|uniref:Uncharacterized protein n=1 Tax=Antarcticimicrobium sediminis TaxID=2546227 RepID=A0A4R5ENY3_9RHOB|nr:hypothetical protein [Antarcticimicrobium sediminis]TDE36317.1 hypothetical protein E1B25_15525 [Antarcticimicrobium sediminis]